MQPQTNNPFPISDTTGEKSPPPVPNPVSSIPKPVTTPNTIPAPTPSGSGAIFVLPSQTVTQSITPSGPLAGLERTLISVFSFPAIQMPEFIKDMFARYLPWMTLMSIFMLAPLLFIGVAMGGFLGMLTSFYSLNTNVFYWLTLMLLIAQVVLLGLSIRPLLGERRKGWSLLFVSTFISIAMMLTNIFAQFINPFIVLAVTLVLSSSTLYVLFQTRDYFTK